MRTPETLPVAIHSLASIIQVKQSGLSGISGMEWWNGIVEWNTGMTFHP